MSVLVRMVPGTIKDRAGIVLTETLARVWREAPGRANAGGQQYDYKGIIGAEGVVVVGKQNRTLTVGDQTFNIVNAFSWESLGYVELDLREVKSDG